MCQPTGSNVGRMPAGDPPFGGQDSLMIVPTGRFEQPTRTLIGFELAEPFQVPPYAAGSLECLSFEGM